MNPIPDHRSTSRVLDILELLASAGQTGYSLSEIARKTASPKSSIFPIIHTLHSRRFIQYNSMTGCYSIGLSAFTVGSAFAAHHSLLDLIRSEMHTVAEHCEEICQMGVPDNDQILYIAKEDTPSPIQLASHVGKRLPLYCTALGKAILMEYSPEKRDSLYPDSQQMHPFTSQTITTRDTLFHQLDIMHKQGFAVENSEYLENVCCIAVPLMSCNTPIAALSVSLPVFHSNPQKFELIQTELFSAKRNIEALLADRSFSSQLNDLLVSI